MPGVQLWCAGVAGTPRGITRKVMRLLAELEYWEGGEGLDDRSERCTGGAQVDLAYLEWGLAHVEGLEIDGEAATIRSCWIVGRRR